MYPYSLFNEDIGGFLFPPALLLPYATIEEYCATLNRSEYEAVMRIRDQLEDISDVKHFVNGLREQTFF